MFTSIEQIKAAKTVDLVAFWNAHVPADQAVKKFRDRQTAEVKVLSIIADTFDTVKPVERGPWPFPKGSDPERAQPEPIGPGMTKCPKCGSEELYEGETIEGIVKNEDKVGGCHHCDFHWDLRLLPKPRSNNSVGVALSWADPVVYAARLVRHGVKVTFDGAVTEHRSVRDAFRHYRLPDSKHIRFRLALKAAKKETFEHGGKLYMFTLVD